jgi:hypothetical protein
MNKEMCFSFGTTKNEGFIEVFSLQLIINFSVEMPSKQDGVMFEPKLE